MDKAESRSLLGAPSWPGPSDLGPRAPEEGVRTTPLSQNELSWPEETGCHGPKTGRGVITSSGMRAWWVFFMITWTA